MPSWNVGLKKALAVTLVAASASAVAASSAQAGNLFTTIGITNTNPETRANGQIRGGWTFPGQEMPPGNTRIVPANDASDDVPLLLPDTTGNRLNLAAYRGQPFTIKADQQKAYTRLHFFGTSADGTGGGTYTLRFADGTTETATFNFPDWCGNPTAPTHIALGRFTGRNTTSGGMDGATCAFFHVVVNISAANAGKTLTTIVMPPSDQPGRQCAGLSDGPDRRDVRRGVRDVRPLGAGPVPERQGVAHDDRRDRVGHAADRGRLVPERDRGQAHGQRPG